MSYRIRARARLINFSANGKHPKSRDVSRMGKFITCFSLHVDYIFQYMYSCMFITCTDIFHRLYSSIEELRATTEFPRPEQFFNKLKQEDIDANLYNDAKTLYESQLALPKEHPEKWFHMGDYLKYYNLLDVVPLVQALQTCFKNYHKYFKVDALSALSLPSIGFSAMYKLFDQCLPYVYSFNNSKLATDSRQHFRDNVEGGLTTVPHRLVRLVHIPAHVL